MKALLTEKTEKLEQLITSYPSVLIAFSGGVDSTLLAYISKKILKNNVLLVTATSSTYPQNELCEAIAFASHYNISHRIIQSEELDIPGFKENPVNRCYYCKQELFSRLKQIAIDSDISVVFDGNNASDIGDFRPGRKAAKELGIISPLEESGLTKAEIRELLRQYNLTIANKPAMACLASRFPYGEIITKEKLSRVETAEQALRDLGFTQFRVRSHGDLARIEFVENEIEQSFTHRLDIDHLIKKAGFTYCSIDTQGYRTGSMNETVSVEIVSSYH
jgi:uncharacterized protein